MGQAQAAARAPIDQQFPDLAQFGQPFIGDPVRGQLGQDHAFEVRRVGRLIATARGKAERP